METSLHQQLKAHYAVDDAQTELRLGRWRIDVVRDDELIEIQHGSLAAIRDKVRQLLAEHRVCVVKPIVVRKRLIKRRRKGGKVVERRMSPKRGRLLGLFDELVYFTRVFPHPNLTLEVPLVDVDEYRYPGHGRRRRRRPGDFVVEDQQLVRIHQVHQFRTSADLAELLPADLPSPFDTQHLAEALEVHRWIAQRIAYCLRRTGGLRQVGKRGNALLYDYPSPDAHAA